MYLLLSIRRALVMAFVVLLVATPVMARDVYKWVDERGTTYYGEHAPVGSVASLEVLEVEAPEATSVAVSEDYRSALELANSLQVDRLARERARLERENLRLQQRAAPQVPGSTVSSSESYVIPYRPYPYRSHPRRPHHGKPHGFAPPHGRLRRDQDPVPDVSIRAYPGRR